MLALASRVIANHALKFSLIKGNQWDLNSASDARKLTGSKGVHMQERTFCAYHGWTDSIGECHQ
jgi:hypothetical protein